MASFHVKEEERGSNVDLLFVPFHTSECPSVTNASTGLKCLQVLSFPGRITSLGWAPESSPHSISERFSSCPGYSELGLKPGTKTETWEET